MYGYYKLIKKLRKESFPEIKGKIMIIQIPFSIPGGAVFCLLPRLKLLALTTKCRKLDKDVLLGLIAHELSHFSIFEKISTWDFYKLVFKLLTNKKFSKKYMIKNERETDLLAIKKGYERELIKMKIKAGEVCKGTKYEKMGKNYLSVKEVKEMIKNKKTKSF